MKAEERQGIYSTLRDRVKIDQIHLTKECSEHPELFALVCDLIVNTEVELSLAERELSRVKGTALLRALKSVQSTGCKSAERSKVLQAITDEDPDVLVAEDIVLTIKTELSKYHRLYEVFRARKDMLTEVSRRDMDTVFQDRWQKRRVEQ